MTNAGAALSRVRWAPTAHRRAAERAELIVRDWPDISPEHRERIRAILAPVLPTADEAA